MKKENTHIVIMAGGIGSRFWPMSVPEYPKQFIDVLGLGKSLIQLTKERLAPLCPKENFWVVTSEHYIEIVKKQLPDIPVSHILAEPEPRNTAPCIAYACWKIRKENADANIVVTPSDALVIDIEEYRRKIKAALSFTESGDRIVTLGMRPTRPETGYGYIESGSIVPTSELTGEDLKDTAIYKVKEFKEKPDLATAEKYLKAGSYYWNAGIFVWNVQTIVCALETFVPQITSIMDKIAAAFDTADESDVLHHLFPTCEKISIDYAVMEKSKHIYVLPAEFGWSDLGSWGSLHEQLNRDEDGNAIVGKGVHLHNCKNCIVHAAEKKKVIVEGLQDYIIADRGDRLLVCRLDDEQHIKEYSQE